MHWLSDFTAWLTSDGARPVVFNALVLAIAVIVAGLLAAWISRGALSSVLTRTERQQKASAITALVDAATEASVWKSLSPQEQILSDRAVGQADMLVRLLPIRGAGTAANWATHQLAEMKRNSATYGYQLDPAVAELRDRLIEWQYHPRRVRKTFQEDLDRWAFEYEANKQDRQRAQEQVDWAQQQGETGDTALLEEASVPAQTAATDEALSAEEPERSQAAAAVVNPGMLPTGPEPE